MQIFSLFGEILLKDNDINTKLDKVDKKANKLGGTFTNSFDKIKSGVLKVGAAIGVGFGFKALIEEGYKLADSASNLNEAQNVVETTFKKSGKAIEDWTNTTAKSAGISKTSATQWVGFMGAMLKSSGVSEDASASMSKNLVQLTGDMSSFYNVSTSDMWEKLRSGISGETEPLKAIGINMSVANLEAYALAEGIKKPYKEMTQGEQTTLRYNYLMKVTKDAQGDFGKTLSTSFANQVRVAQLNLSNLGQSIGVKLLPIFNKAVTWLNTNMPQIQEKITNVMKTIGDAFNFFVDGIKGSGDPEALIGTWEGAIYKLGDVAGKAFKTAKDAFGFFIDGINGVGDPDALIGTYGRQIYKLGEISKDVFVWLTNNLNVVKDAAKALTAIWIIQKGVLLAHTIALTAHNIQLGIKKGLDIFETGQIVALYIAEGIHTGITWAMVAAQTALNFVLSTNPIGLVIIAIVALVGVFVLLYNKSTTFRNFINTLWDNLKAFASSIPKAFTDMKNSVVNVFESIVKKIEDIKNKVKQKIKDMFSFDLPHIKLPHINIQGKLSLVPPSVPKLGIDWYAKGTDYFQGGLAGINEAGGEIINLPKGSQIIPHDVSMEMAKNNGLTLNITNFYNNREQDIEELAEEIQFYIKQTSLGIGGN